MNNYKRYSYHRQPPSKACTNLYGSSSPDGERLSGFLFADGRVSIGRIPRYRESEADREYEANKGEVEVYNRTHWDYREGLVKEQIHVRHPSKESSLGLSSVSNYQEGATRKRYGLRGITLNGMRRVKLGAYLLHYRYARRLGFYTLTCPYTIATDIYEYNKNIAEISRRYFQFLRKLYIDAGAVWSCVYVYEYQPIRYERDGIPVLHIHYVAPCYLPGTKEFILSADILRYVWGWACKQVLGIEADTEASIDAVVVKTSAAGYLAKYLSKGSCVAEHFGQICPSQVPSQWWGMSQNVRKAISITTTPLPLEISRFLFYAGGDEPGGLLHLHYKRYIDIQIGFDYGENTPINLRVGMSARLCRAGDLALRRWEYKDILFI